MGILSSRYSGLESTKVDEDLPYVRHRELEFYGTIRGDFSHIIPLFFCPSIIILNPYLCTRIPRERLKGVLDFLFNLKRKGL